jgi:hypothetical protein
VLRHIQNSISLRMDPEAGAQHQQQHPACIGFHYLHYSAKSI